ncbi:MAG: RNA ligase [Archaeoglobaceae archaeon]
MNFVSEALNLSKFSTERLEERGILKRAFVKHPFFRDIIDAFRIDKKFGIYEEGTLVVHSKDGLKVFRGFPKIKRILYLESGLKKHFGSKKIALEEKMNGYNVRIAKIGEEIYAITRRGLICPYTSEKVRERIPKEFFKEFPEHMLCCEAIGSASPYVPDYYGIEGLEFFLFDIRECRTNRPVSIGEKEEIAERYGIKMVKILLKTHADDLQNIKKVVEELNSRGREGIVFKDLEMILAPLKYTTSFSNCGDLSYAFKNFEEYGRDFMLARIIREAFQTFEFRGDIEERAYRLGKAILSSAVDSIRKVSEGKEVTEDLRLTFSNEDVLELFKMHLKLLGVNLREIKRIKKGEKVEVEFERVMRATTDKIKSLLEGNPW